jgi:hypothetical protein
LNPSQRAERYLTTLEHNPAGHALHANMVTRMTRKQFGDCPVVVPVEGSRA